MKTTDWHGGTRRTVIAAALLCASAFAQGQAPAAAEKSETVREGSVSVGVGAVSGNGADRAIFGQYNGLRPHSGYGLLDFDYYLRNDETATVTRFQGFNVLGEGREMSFVWKRQGDMSFWADYGELVRREPYTVNSAMLGFGTTSPQIVHLPAGPGSGTNFDPSTKRTALGLGFKTQISPTLLFEASAKSENKDGTRLYGRGMNCPSTLAPGCAFTTGISSGWAVLLVPEPVNSNHTQLEARLGYAQGKLRLGAGYYGSIYTNSNPTLNPIVPGSLNGPLGNPLPLNAGLLPILNQPIALWPDNQAHHFDVSGSYAFTGSTRANFKLGYARATQDQNFAAAGLFNAPAGVSSLGGKVSTSLAQLGITSRPTPKLSILGDVRYEDKDDQTPIALYNLVGTATFTNGNVSRERLRGKLQASYQFTRDYRGTLGADYESIDRGVFTATSAVSGVSALREKTDEVGYRAELRRRMSDNFSGSLSFITSRRDGSDWLRPNSGLGVTEVTDPSTGFFSTATFMPSLADRQRDKLRLVANWQPSEELSLQFSVEDGKDRFSAPTDQGVRSSRMNLYTIDWNYALSFRWNVNGYISQGNQKLNQARPGGYILAFDNTSTNIGLNLVGKPTSNLEVGGGISFIDDRNVYAQTLDTLASAGSVALLAATGGLPEIVFRRIELRVFGNYKLSERSALRADLIHQYAKFNDWSYGYLGVPFVFGDNTTLTQLQSQRATFVGVRYIYTWR